MRLNIGCLTLEARWQQRHESSLDDGLDDRTDEEPLACDRCAPYVEAALQACDRMAEQRDTAQAERDALQVQNDQLRARRTG